jgi:hypothetical protein
MAKIIDKELKYGKKSLLYTNAGEERVGRLDQL